MASDPEHKHKWEIPLFATVGAMILLYFYYRLFKRFCCVASAVSYRYRVGGQPLNEANTDNSSLRFHGQGLEPLIVRSLRMSQFKKKNNQGEDSQLSNTDDCCAVCMGEFEEAQWLKHLPNCSHAFHAACIDTWFQSHSDCPLCRSTVYDLTIHTEYSVSVNPMLQPLRREDFFQERTTHYSMLSPLILPNSRLRHDQSTNAS